MQYELRHGKEKSEGIIHYVRMRRDSARQQLQQLRAAIPRASDRAGFPAVMEPLPPGGEEPLPPGREETRSGGLSWWPRKR